jgi:Tfp pilus assembly protein PilV
MRNEEHQNDAGFGMIEIVVSMFMLALLAIAFLPVLLTGVRSTASNAVTATATQLANQSLEATRASTFATCAALQGLRSTTVEDDGRGGDLQVIRTVTCSDGDGQPEIITVIVREADGDRTVLARATTFVRLVS